MNIGKLLWEKPDSGAEISVDHISIRIGECRTIEELLDLYQNYPQFKEALQPEFEQKKRSILINQEVTTQLINQKINENGTS